MIYVIRCYSLPLSRGPWKTSSFQISLGNLLSEISLSLSLWRRWVYGRVQWVTIDTYIVPLFLFCFYFLFLIALMHGINTIKLMMLLFKFVIPSVVCILVGASILINFSKLLPSHWEFRPLVHFSSGTLFLSSVSIGFFNIKFNRRELSLL